MVNVWDWGNACKYNFVMPTKLLNYNFADKFKIKTHI